MLNGRITLELTVLGILIAGLIWLLAFKVIGLPADTDLRLLRNLPLLTLYILNLLLEIVKAAWTVMLTVYRADEPDPVIVEFHSGLHTKMQNVLLANSITLTPGTITVFQEGDHFVVHCLHREYAEGMEDSSFVRLLRKMKS